MAKNILICLSIVQACRNGGREGKSAAPPPDFGGSEVIADQRLSAAFLPAPGSRLLDFVVCLLFWKLHMYINLCYIYILKFFAGIVYRRVSPAPSVFPIDKKS